jgi:hypothetical protein
MDLKMTDEQKLICAAIRRFVREQIIPLEESELDADAYELPEEHEARLRPIAESTGIPGANGLDAKTKVFIAEEAAQHRAGLYHPCYGLFTLGDDDAVEGAEAGGFIGLSASQSRAAVPTPAGRSAPVASATATSG